MSRNKMSVKTQLLLNRAEQYCLENKQRFTQPRHDVLLVLASHGRSIGAYEVMEALSTRECEVKPPTVYRAIEFWVAHGFVHKIESKNAFIACNHTTAHPHSLIMICRVCDGVQEVALPDLPDAINATMKYHEFMTNKSVLEISGVCRRCDKSLAA